MNTLDRCDSCGAQAYVTVVVPNAAHRLLFCGNHWGRVKPALEAKYGEDFDFDDSYLTSMRHSEQNKELVDAE